MPPAASPVLPGAEGVRKGTVHTPGASRSVYCTLAYSRLEGTGQSLEEVPKLYQTDTGIAFWLVAESLQRSNLFHDAHEYFQLSLNHNPYLWSSLVALCEWGHTVSLEEIYIAENCPVFCSEAPYIPDRTLQNQSEAGRKENPETRKPGILPRPLESEVSKRKSFGKVCMELSLESGFKEKTFPENRLTCFSVLPPLPRLVPSRSSAPQTWRTKDPWSGAETYPV